VGVGMAELGPLRLRNHHNFNSDGGVCQVDSFVSLKWVLGLLRGLESLAYSLMPAVGAI
jgi:hypothetical protein